MRLEYSITLEDYQAAQSLHWRQTFARRVLNFLIYDGIPCLAAASCCALMKRAGLLGSGSSYWFEFLFGLAIASIYLLITAKGRNTRRFKKRFGRDFPPDTRRAWIEFNDKGITSAIIGTAPANFAWSSLLDFARDDKVTLFHIRKGAFLFFPTSVLSPDQLAELNALVARCLVKKS